MKYYKGESLIDLMVFITIIGIFVAGSLSAMKTVLFYNNRPGTISTASKLASARMNLILLQRQLYGFENLTDPCDNTSLDACKTLANFASNNGYNISSSISDINGETRTATVTVTGAGNATNTERFVQ